MTNLLGQSKNTSVSRGKIYVSGLGKRSSKYFSPKPIENLRGPKLLHFTSHSRAKMRQYGLSEARIKRVMHTPKRLEEGIAPKTVAMMQPTFVKTTAGKESWKQEIWIMLTEEKNERKIISAWRYPGITKPGEPLPDEILKEMRGFNV